MSKDHLKPIFRGFRSALWSVLRAVGVFELVARSRWRRDRLLILCYHGVSLADEHEWHSELFITPAFLERRLNILRDKGYNVLPLGEAVEALRNKALPAKSVVLTFDDGFYDYLAEAVPLLEAYCMPATNYVSTYHVQKQTPLVELSLNYLVWKGRERVLPAGAVIDGWEAVDLGDKAQAEAFTRRVIDAIRGLADDKPAQIELLRKLADGIGMDWPAFEQGRLLGLMSEAELADVAAKGFDIQLHTHRHRSPRDEALFKREIEENRQVLEACTGRPAVHFCYPSGDVDDRFLPWLRAMDVVSATTGRAALATRDEEPLLLPRFVDTMAQSDLVFESWLCGIADLLKWHRR